MTTDEDTLTELRALLQDWARLDEESKLSLLDRLTRRNLTVYWRVPTYPHLFVSDYPGGRPGLRWTPEQQALPSYCLHCGVPHNVRLLSEDCWARTPRGGDF